MNSANRKDPTVKTSMLGRNTMLRSVAALAAALASLAFFAAPAQAYDQGTCNSWHAPKLGYLADVDRVKSSVGSVDFGDGWHLGGSPTGDAVICWGSEAQVAIFGRLYADSPTPITAGINVTYYGTYNTVTTPIMWFDGQNGQSAYVGWEKKDIGHIYKVRIRLYDCGAPNVMDGCELVNTITRNYGD
jgi:hypothetical protein